MGTTPPRNTSASGIRPPTDVTGRSQRQGEGTLRAAIRRLGEAERISGCGLHSSPGLRGGAEASLCAGTACVMLDDSRGMRQVSNGTTIWTVRYTVSGGNQVHYKVFRDRGSGAEFRAMVGATRRGFRIRRSASLTRPSCRPSCDGKGRDEGSSSLIPFSQPPAAQQRAYLRAPRSRSFTPRRPRKWKNRAHAPRWPLGP